MIVDAKEELERSARPSKKEGFLDRVAEPLVRGYDNWKASSRLNEILDELVLAMKPDLDSLAIEDSVIAPIITHLRSVVGQIPGEMEKQTANEERIESYKETLTQLDEQISEARNKQEPHGRERCFQGASECFPANNPLESPGP